MKSEHKITDGDIVFWGREIIAQHTTHTYLKTPFYIQLLKLAKAVKEI